jgi:hypothetical protein
MRILLKLERQESRMIGGHRRQLFIGSSATQQLDQTEQQSGVVVGANTSGGGEYGAG